MKPRIRSKPIASVAIKSKNQSMDADSSENQELDGHYDPMRLLEYLKEMRKESRLDVTIQPNSSAQEGDVSASDDDESLALYRHAKEEQRQGQLFKAFHIYVQVIRIQLKSHQLRWSSPSRKALRQICKILIQLFPEIGPLSYRARGWWSSDTIAISYTLNDSVFKMPSNLATVEVLQTLADYIMKWYTPESLDCAARLYERILSQLDRQISFSYDKRRPYIVKELAKIYVERLSASSSWPEDISSAQHTIIREGRLEIEKCSISERMQFYQHLGALYVQRGGKDPQCSGREGEEILQRIYKIQKQLFGCADYRSVKTADILSRYYAEQGGKDVEAAQLIADVLKADRPTPRYEDPDREVVKKLRNERMQRRIKESVNARNLEDLSRYYAKQRGGSDAEIVQLIEDVHRADQLIARYDDSDEEGINKTQYERMWRAIKESENARAGQGDRDPRIAQLVADVLKADRPTPRYDDSDKEDVEEAGDERRRRAIEEGERSLSLTDTRSTDHKYLFWRLILSDRLQGRLMSLLAPENCVWEDSRLYLSDITKIRFQRVKITDTLENYPVRVTRVGNGEVDVQAPIIAHPSSANDEAMTARISKVICSVRESDFYELLRSGATADHFAVQRPMTTSGHQTNDTTRCVRTSDFWDETSNIQPDLTRSDIQHVFWVFPRDLNSVAADDQVHGIKSLSPRNLLRKSASKLTQLTRKTKRKTDSSRPRKRWLSYQFQKLSDRPEWMVVVNESKQIWSPGDFRDTYPHAVRVSSWDWISFDNSGCSIDEGEGSGISVVCPYVAYEDLCQVTGYRWGFTYADFVQQLRSSQRTGDFSRLLEIKKGMCKEWSAEANKELYTILIDETRQMPQSGTSEENSERYHQGSPVGDDGTEGFFNNIPGRGIWIHHETLVPGFNFNLVSSQWADWETFVSKDSILTTDYPELRSANGDSIKCRGCISGSWIPGNLEGRYAMEKVFVVDAVFTTSKEPQRQWEFVFSRSNLTGNSRAERKSYVFLSRLTFGMMI
ncbi:hypothetical protein F5Y07DRAFT_376441 [Xylaria sp. FL0933]|nr:hypothetical protein F5Y07DRAFT_376441 [Xylaria sp. FL0933]